MSTSTQQQNKDCRLLNMPVETLQRITDLLDKREDLFAVRLACKTLDYVSLERFTRAFSTVKCCIFYESRWIRLMKIVSGPSRITRRIKKIHLTTCFFEDGGHDDLQLAPVQADANVPLSNSQSAAFIAHSKSEAAAVQHSPNLALMSSVLRNIEKVFPPKVRFHLVENQCEANGYVNAHRDALFTLAAAHSLRLKGIRLNQDSLWGFSQSFAHLRQDLLRCTSRLDSFHLWSARGDSRRVGRPFYAAIDLTPFNNAFEILRSAKKLRVLHLSLHLVHYICIPAITIARGFLEAIVSSNIRSLKLIQVRVEEEVLLKALPRWVLSLRSVTLDRVVIYTVHKGWPAIFHTLSAMPNLAYLEMRELVEGSEDKWRSNTVSLEPPHITLMTRGVDLDLARPGGMKKYDGRREVMSGLKELLAKPLMYEDFEGLYTGQRNNVDGEFRV
jgi:hypothetical protein